MATTQGVKPWYRSSLQWFIWPMSSPDIVGATQLPFVILNVGTTSG